VRGKLSDKPFPVIVRDLAHENATGRLRLTQQGKIREILIESGIPVFASSTIPEEQPESRLVQEGLVTPEQLDSAMVTAKQTSQPVEKILVQTKAISRLGLQRILCDLSAAIVNSASEWVAGDYLFVAAPKIPLEAKLIWTSTECILSGARLASSNASVLEAIAPDDRTVKPASDPANSAANSATLSSTEGYVLSCIQSPTTIAETSTLTGLSHMETRRAILVLILLGLLEPEVGGAQSSNAVDESGREDWTSNPIRESEQPRSTKAMPEAQQARISEPVPEAEQVPSSKTMPEVQQARTSKRLYEAPQEVRPRARGIEADQSVWSEQIAEMPLRVAQPSAADSATSSATTDLRAANDDQNAVANGESEMWPLEFESNRTNEYIDDSGQMEFNSGDISFADFPEQTWSPQSPDGGGCASAHTDSVNGEMAALPPVAAQPTAPVRERVGSIFIPPTTAPAGQDSARTGSRSSAPIRENTGSIFIPGSGPLRVNAGSMPSNGARAPQDSPRDPTPFAAPPTAPMGEYPSSPNGTGALQQPQVAQPFFSQPPSDSKPGDGWNGESDPRLHQEWRDQMASSIQDSGDDEKVLKRVIEELGAKMRIAASADHYQVLGVDKLASNGSITKAYERITRVNDNHKSRWPYSAELQGQISSLMAIVDKAFETLGNPEKRRLYDMPPKQQAPAIEIERGSGARAASPGAPPSPVPTVNLPPNSRPLPVPPIPANLPPNSRPLPVPPITAGLPGAGPAVERRNPYETAEELYKRGRSCFARSDLQAAAHLLRQAVTLDPNRSSYHYQLGMTLFILSQARSDHKHDKGCHVTCKMGGNLTRNQRIRHEAEQHLLRASELEPSNSDIKLKLALLYKDANMDRKAHQYFYEALMLDPQCHIAQVELGLEDTSKKDEDQWIKDLMKDRTKKK
jgi:tetratricopeptide (TPR) repeat protein